MQLRIEGGAPLRGELRIPSDKSIVHRALIFSALAEGESRIDAPGVGADNASTAAVLRELGVDIEAREDCFRVQGVGPGGLRGAPSPLDCGNSGTTMRLLAGALAGCGVRATLVGDTSLSLRPMGRVCAPLRSLGAGIRGNEGADGRERPPLVISPSRFRGGAVELSVASAQVKTALLLAGLCSGQKVEVKEPFRSRDHSERMLAAMGAGISCQQGKEGNQVVLPELQHLHARDVRVPGDFSSAAFFLAAGALTPGSKLTLREVGVNPTRTGLLEVAEELGAAVQVTEWHEELGEPSCTLTVETCELTATRAGGGPCEIGGAIIPRMIDELVVLAALASQAHGRIIIRDAHELRVKESDRIEKTVALLAAFGVDVEEHEDGFTIEGPQPLHAAHVDVGCDHRIALSAAVLAAAAPGKSVLEGFDVAGVSFPRFVETLASIGGRVRMVDEPVHAPS